MSVTGGPSLFCFGYGYSCDHLGMALRRQADWRIAGTTRDADKKAQMQESGIRAFVFDYQKPLADPQMYLNGITHLLISTPPDDSGDPAYVMHADDILAIPTLKWIGYLSSTGVYGDRQGGWVDEQSEVRPTTKRGSRRARAEEQWMTMFFKHALPVHIFRLAGIYGPGRSALDSLRAGVARRIEKKGHAFSRIHIDDIVNVLMASIARPNPGAIYNLADDNAAPSHEVIAYACELLGLVPPPLIQFEDADMVPMARSFYADNKRVRNDRIKDELGVVLKYPDYRAGLQGCLDYERHIQSTGHQALVMSGGGEG